MERTHSSDLMFQQDTPAFGGFMPLRALATLLLWQRRVNTRRELARLDERLLADAGISLHQREAELNKPFWR